MLLVRYSTDDHVRFGARKNSSGYFWKDGTNVSANLWDEGEPNSSNGAENCVEVARYLNDAPCDLRQA